MLVVLGSVCVCWGGVAAWLLGAAWRRAPLADADPRPDLAALVLPREQYALLIDRHERPYVYEIQRASDGAGVLVFGAEHTKDPKDPQLSRLESAWEAFRPTVLLVEGRLGMLFPAFHEPVAMFGETGFAAGLARRAGVRTLSWEPSSDRLVESVLAQGFTSEQVGLRFILGPYFSNLRHGRPADPEAFVRDTLAERARMAGVSGTLAEMARVDAAWVREFPGGPDWRDVSDQFGLPGFLGRMDMNRARDEHLVFLIADLAGRGERVFVVAGSSHAVVIEPALRSILDGG